jgi:hypothetical protein
MFCIVRPRRQTAPVFDPWLSRTRGSVPRSYLPDFADTVFRERMSGLVRIVDS